MNKKELDLKNMKIRWQDLYKEHPIRFVMASIILGLWMLGIFRTPIVHFDLVDFMADACMNMFFMWIVYGPINYHRVKRHKEIQVTADYILNNQTDNTSKEVNYCTNCGTKMEKDWIHCPVCGNKNYKEKKDVLL